MGKSDAAPLKKWTKNNRCVRKTNDYEVFRSNYWKICDVRFIRLQIERCRSLEEGMGDTAPLNNVLSPMKKSSHEQQFEIL